MGYGGGGEAGPSPIAIPLETPHSSRALLTEGHILDSGVTSS